MSCSTHVKVSESDEFLCFSHKGNIPREWHLVQCKLQCGQTVRRHAMWSIVYFLTGLLAVAVKSQDSIDQSSLTGTSDVSIPTGTYLTYASTRTRSSTPISTILVTSVVTSPSTYTTVFNSTIYSLLSASGNSSVSTTSSKSQTLLQGSNNPVSIANGTQSYTAPLPSNTQPCNNYPEFCTRSYANITEVSAHNSPFVRPGNAAANQALPVATQLNDGIRLLQGQVHFVDGVPHFCHTSCEILDAGPITQYLGDVYDWVRAHPYDIVTILLGNSDARPATDYASFIEETGLVRFAYQPPQIPMAKDDWPTLADMILHGQRVVFFMDYEANQDAVPWILDEFSQMWETPFSPTDRSFPCNAQRPPNITDEQARSRLYLTNHNLNYEISLLGNSLLVPTLPLLNVTNNVTGEGSLGVGVETCVSDWQYPPKFLNVDFYEVGNGTVFEVAARWNNVTYNRPCCGVKASLGTTTRASSVSLLLMLCCLVVWSF